METNELYVSIDVETDGPIPSEYSMLSIGSATFDSDGNIIDKFECNLKELTHAEQDKETMDWWATEPEAWKYCRENPIEPNDAIIELQTMNEVHEALNKLIELHPHSPYTISMCSFLLGVYMGLQYHNVKKLLGE